MTALELEQQREIEALTATVRHQRERLHALELRCHCLEESRTITNRLLVSGSPGPGPRGDGPTRRED